MTSKKIDMLEKMRHEEERLKLRQKELAEEIQLDMHRDHLLEQSGTIIKLKTQLDLYRNKIIEEEIAPNNYKLLIMDKHQEYDKLINFWNQPENRPDYDDKVREIIQMKRDELGKFNQNLLHINQPTSRVLITATEYFDNISKCSEETIEMAKLNSRKCPSRLVDGNFPGKNAHDILPILTTILGILDKHQSRIY